MAKYLLYARHYNPKFVYFYLLFLKLIMNCDLWPYVWLVFKSGFNSRVLQEWVIVARIWYLILCPSIENLITNITITSIQSNKLEGFFVDEARQRLRQLEAVPDFNTQLSFVSIVGGRGVGKSTVASLLSGNASLFDVGR